MPTIPPKFLPGAPKGRLWVPEWQEDLLQFAASIATPKAKAEMNQALKFDDGFRFYDCSATKACQVDNQLSYTLRANGSTSSRQLAHAHCFQDRNPENYGMVCIFSSEMLRSSPSFTILHEIAHFTSQPGHGAAWMKRFKIMLEHEGFDTSRREINKYSSPKLQSLESWNR